MMATSFMRRVYRNCNSYSIRVRYVTFSRERARLPRDTPQNTSTLRTLAGQPPRAKRWLWAVCRVQTRTVAGW
jgi:hypothetical protein